MEENVKSLLQYTEQPLDVLSDCFMLSSIICERLKHLALITLECTLENTPARVDVVSQEIGKIILNPIDLLLK